MASSLVYALLASPVLYAVWHTLLKRRSRTKVIPRNQERVLILGASSGVGRTLALLYTTNGAKVCIVGRRMPALEAVKDEGLKTRRAVDSSSLLAVAADFTSPEDMVRVRSEIETAWGGIDTVIVSAGVSAIRPLLSIAGLEKPSSVHSNVQISAEHMHRTIDIVNAAVKGNFTGPLVAALAFIPLMQFSSRSPSILLVSSLAAVVPAPTRSVYAATKAAALLLYQALSIEHPAISFSFIMPTTVEGSFRSSAVDRGDAPDVYADKFKQSLTQEAVAKRCMQAIDAGEKHVFMPELFCRTGHAMYWWAPWSAEAIARRMYGFSAST